MRKTGDGRKYVVQKKASVFEVGPKKVEPEPIVQEEVKVAEEPVQAAPAAAPVMDITQIAAQLAALQALLAGGVAPAPVERAPVEEPVVEEEEQDEPAVEELVEDKEEVEEQADESESESTEAPIEVVCTETPQMVLMYKFYKDIFDNFNWMRKFKDDGRLILTPNQLVAFLSLVCGIDRNAIRIQCDVKPKRRYSDGKIYKVVKIGIECDKELPDLDKVFKSYNISAEYVNYSEKLMSVEY